MDTGVEGPTVDTCQPLIDIAVESWRFAKIFAKVLTKLDAGEAGRYTNQLRYFQKRLDDSLQAAGLRLVNLEGQDYDLGMAASALNIGDYGTDEQLYVEQMVEPILMGANGVVKAGTMLLARRNDLNVIEAVISRLEDADVQTRRNDAYRLKNALAADVASALNTFITNNLAVFSTGNQLPNYQEVMQNIVVTPEPITNTLLISATPRCFEDMMRIIEVIDQMPPQVMVQVCVAEVDLNDDCEFGVELGLQNPLLFYRSFIPTVGNLAGATVSYASSASTGGSANPFSLLPVGATVTGTNIPAGQPGFNFNGPNIGSQLGQNVTAGGAANIGVQGITNFGVGRVSPNSQHRRLRLLDAKRLPERADAGPADARPYPHAVQAATHDAGQPDRPA